MLSTRLVIGFSMVGAILAVLCLDEWFAPWFPIWFVLSVVALGMAARELVGLLTETTARASSSTVLAGVIALVVANWGPHVAGTLNVTPRIPEYPIYDPMEPVSDLGWPLMTFAGIVMVAFFVQSLQFRKPGGATASIAGTILAVTYIGLLGSFIIQMRWFEGPYHGILPLAFLFAAAKGADTGAYTTGRIAGRHKLWPRLSPNKTVEGAIGGLVFAVAFAGTTAAIARYLLRVPTLSWAATVGFGLLVGAAAQVGDLMESMIKRDCARKDASASVPGFGGVLDILDSLLFAGPVAFAYWLWLGP